LRNLAAVLPLISALHDQNHDVRAVAITALGRFGDERAIEPLIIVLIEQKDHRHACIEALRALCGDDLMEELYTLIRECKRMANEKSHSILERIYTRKNSSANDNSDRFQH
jgi:hypothetical protein